MYPAKRKPWQPPKRKKKPLREGKVTQTIRRSGPEMSDLRDRVFLRSQGICERNLRGCQGYTPYKLGNLSHIRSRGAGGSDTEENTLWSCFPCHVKSHNCDGKPCPPKPERTA